MRQMPLQVRLGRECVMFECTHAGLDAAIQLTAAAPCKPEGGSNPATCFTAGSGAAHPSIQPILKAQT